VRYGEDGTETKGGVCGQDRDVSFAVEEWGEEIVCEKEGEE
jgi:hypothetical protein